MFFVNKAEILSGTSYIYICTLCGRLISCLVMAIRTISLISYYHFYIIQFFILYRTYLSWTVNPRNIYILRV